MTALSIRWYGHATFGFDDGARLLVDPFVVPDPPDPGTTFAYPPLDGVEADMLLVTHEHRDHNAVHLVAGDPFLIRSRAGRFETPRGTVVGVASEHDEAAGTLRGANVMYTFGAGDLTVCHAGDLGQRALRPEQLEALGEIDLLLVPVGGRFVMDGETAALVVRAVRPRTVVPMHYGTYAINYLDPVDAFVAQFDVAQVKQLTVSEIEWSDEQLGTPDSPVVLVFDPPR